MNPTAALALTNLLLGLLDRATQVSTLLQKSRAEGRDPTVDEMDALFAEDAQARVELANAIAAAQPQQPTP